MIMCPFVLIVNWHFVHTIHSPAHTWIGHLPTKGKGEDPKPPGPGCSKAV